MVALRSNVHNTRVISKMVFNNGINEDNKISHSMNCRTNDGNVQLLKY